VTQVLRDFVIGAVERGKGLDESCLVDGNQLQQRWVDIFLHFFLFKIFVFGQNGNHPVQTVRRLPHRSAVLGFVGKFFLELVAVPRSSLHRVSGPRILVPKPESSVMWTLFFVLLGH
jgi:hypothetical protein